MTYLLFAGDYGHGYSGEGGWNDFKGAFATVEEADEHGAASGMEWWHIVDLKIEEIVKCGEIVYPPTPKEEVPPVTYIDLDVEQSQALIDHLSRRNMDDLEFV